ncbi:DUF2933 domain-containing protein [Aromatoleum toluclasticum]
MMPTHDHSAHDTSPGTATAKMSQRSKWVFGGFAAIALVLLAFEHRVHLAGWLPWLILLACPLMHVFMHGGHGHGGHGTKSDSGDEK